MAYVVLKVFHTKAVESFYSLIGFDKCLSDAHKNSQTLKKNNQRFLLQKQIQPLIFF